jgi:hypothetical protein
MSDDAIYFSVTALKVLNLVGVNTMGSNNI